MTLSGTDDRQSSEGSYGYPTFRFCAVCDRINSLEYDHADSVRITLKNNWDLIKTKLEKDSNKYGLIKVHRIITDLKEDYYEGPAIMFPELEAELENNIRVMIRASVTVCVKPHHSKLWVRVSYIKNPVHKLKLGEVREFYQKAESVTRLIAGELLELYKVSLAQNGITELLVEAHEICIETMSKDLEVVAEFFEKEAFKVSALLEEDERFQILSGFLSLAYQKSIMSLEDLEGLSGELDWFKMRVHKPDIGEMVGVYSLCHTEVMTRFSGLVQEPPRVSLLVDNECHLTREFSKKLVQHIAPAF